MSIRKLIRFAYLAYFSRPAQDRVLYRSMRKQRPRTILEIGIGKAARSARLLEVARLVNSGGPRRYTGIDLFEDRTDRQSGVSLKRVHQLLGKFEVPVRLLPGDPFSALARHANSMMGTDFVVISKDLDQESLRRAWFYLPRMLTDVSVVFWEEAGATAEASCYRRLTAAEIKEKAEAARRLRRAAA